MIHLVKELKKKHGVKTRLSSPLRRRPDTSPQARYCPAPLPNSPGASPGAAQAASPGPRGSLYPGHRRPGGGNSRLQEETTPGPPVGASGPRGLGGERAAGAGYTVWTAGGGSCFSLSLSISGHML